MVVWLLKWVLIYILLTGIKQQVKFLHLIGHYRLKEYSGLKSQTPDIFENNNP